MGCEHLCQSVIEVLLFDQWLFLSRVIVDLSLLSLINVRCFIMCQVLGVHLFYIGCHWSFFLLSLVFPFLLSGGFALGFYWQYIIFFIGFFHLPTLSFRKMPHFLIFNNLRKGSNQLSFWGIHHGHSIGVVIVSKIGNNKKILSCIDL